MYTVVYVHAKSNKQPLDNHSQRRVCQSLFKLRPKSGEKCWLIFSLHYLVCANTHRYTSGWNNGAPLFENPPWVWKRQAAYETIIIALRLHVDESFLFGDIFFLTLMLLFFSLLSTGLRPPSSPGGSRPSEGPALSLKWTMLLLAKAKTSNCKPGLLSLSGYAADAGWPPHTNTQHCALTWGSMFFDWLQINT